MVPCLYTKRERFARSIGLREWVKEDGSKNTWLMEMAVAVANSLRERKFKKTQFKFMH